MTPALLALADLDRGPGAALLAATARVGFSEPVARAGLLAELDAWRAPGALDAVLAELPADLPAAARPDTVLVIAARTLPASTLRAVLMARLLGARVLLKTASGQDDVAAAIAAADPAVTPRPFASTDLIGRDAALADADAVVVLGGDSTVADVRAHTRPDSAFLGYGHRVSAAWVDHPDDAVAAGLAADLLAWDQAGCLAPQLVWCAGDPVDLAARVAAAVHALEPALPMDLPPGAARARHTAATLATMRGGHVFGTATARVATLPDPAFRASPGHRFLWVLPADEDALRASLPVLSTLAGDAPAAVPLPGHVRRCAPGAMQRPPLTWRHDGLPNLLPMLRLDAPR